MEKKQIFDLGSQNVLKTFMYIFIPTLIAQLIAGTFVIFDTFFVSHGFGPFKVFGGEIGNLSTVSTSYASLGPAAVSYAFPYTFFIMGVGIAIGAGLSVIITRQIANNDFTGEQRTMNSYLPLSIISGIILMIFLLIFAKVLVWFGSGFQKDYLTSWFNNPLMNSNWEINEDLITKEVYQMINGHILSQAAWYLRILALGAIPYVYMVGGVIMLRVQGKAQYATIFSSTGLVVNILFDFIFIMILKMNIVGAAIATVLGQIITASIYFYYFKKKARVKSTSLDWSESKKIFKKVFVDGISLMMLQVITGILLVMFTFNIGITNYGDMGTVTNYTAVYQGYNAIFIFSNLLIIAVAQSMKAILDFNLAKKNVNNVKQARKIGYSISMGFSIIMMLLVVIFPKSIIGVFYSVNGSSIDFITTGVHGNLDSSGNSLLPVYTNGMDIASKIIQILFISFPFAILVLMSGTYIQSFKQNKRTSIILFGKIIMLLPLLLIFGFLLPSIVHSEWKYYKDPIGLEPYIFNDGFNSKANLGIFLSLPILDIAFALLTIYFLIDIETKIIKPLSEKYKTIL